MNRGDIVRVNLPQPVGPPGREQFGPRPAIVVQTGGVTATLSTVLVVPFTSRRAALCFPGSFTISPTSTNGLACESVALTHQLRAIDRNRIHGVIGRLTSEELGRLESELRRLLGL